VGLERPLFEQSVAEVDQLRVEDAGFEDEERERLKACPDPDLYWGNSLGAFEEPRSQPLSYAGPGSDDFLLKAPAPLDIPFGDSLLLRSLESSNDGFLPSMREGSSKQLASKGSSRRESGSILGRSKSSGDLMFPGKQRPTSRSEDAGPEPEGQPDRSRNQPPRMVPEPGSGKIGRDGVSKGGSHSTPPADQEPGREGPREQGGQGRRSTSSSGVGAQLQLSKAMLGEQPGDEQGASRGAAAQPSKPFMALFPALPGQMTEVGFPSPLVMLLCYESQSRKCWPGWTRLASKKSVLCYSCNCAIGNGLQGENTPSIPRVGALSSRVLFIGLWLLDFHVIVAKK
jgi:hypothetical protein